LKNYLCPGKNRGHWCPGPVAKSRCQLGTSLLKLWRSRWGSNGMGVSGVVLGCSSEFIIKLIYLNEFA
jgi:hypothetical protein